MNANQKKYLEARIVAAKLEYEAGDYNDRNERFALWQQLEDLYRVFVRLDKIGEIEDEEQT